MKIVYSRLAVIVMSELYYYKERRNTPGSCRRYITVLKAKIEKLIRPVLQYPLCNYPSLKVLGYSCITIRKWVILFYKEEDSIIIHTLINSSLLKE